MKKIITTLSAGVLAVAFSSASFSGHHESGEGMDMGGMPMPPGVPPMSDAPLMGMDGMPMPPGAPPMSEGARAINEASHYAKKFLKDVSQPPEAQESVMADEIEALIRAKELAGLTPVAESPKQALDAE
jgi:hypothetical protein